MGSSRRKKKMTSILPDSLDVIEECSENSENSSLEFRSMSPKKPNMGGSSDDAETMTSDQRKIVDDNNNSKGRRRSFDVSPLVKDHRSVGSIPAHMAIDNGYLEGGRNGHNNRAALDNSDDTAGTQSTSTSSHDSGHRKGLHEQQTTSGPSSPVKETFDDEADYDHVSSSSKNSRNSRTSVASADSDRNDPRSTGPPLSWRLESSRPSSDWMLKVLNRDNGEVQTFYLHQNYLGVGKRRSEYFVNAFRNPKSPGRNVTEVSFCTAAVRAIPPLLDFIYTDDPPNFSCEYAVGIRFLAQFFGIKVLFKAVMDFIQKDLCLATMVPYYRDSANLKDEKMLVICSRHCARNILKIDPLNKLLHVIDPPFFIRIMSAPGIVSDERRRHLSELVAEYCRYHKNSLDDKTFLMLTNEEYIPIIRTSAALVLLELEADLVIATSISSFSSMSSLQMRCINALAAYWKVLSEADPKETARVCRKLPSFVVTELMVQSLSSAAHEKPTVVASSSGSGSDGSDPNRRSGSRGRTHSPNKVRADEVATKDDPKRGNGEPRPARSLKKETSLRDSLQSDSGYDSRSFRSKSVEKTEQSRSSGAPAERKMVKQDSSRSKSTGPDRLPPRGLTSSQSLVLKNGEFIPPERGISKGGSLRIGAAQESPNKRKELSKGGSLRKVTEGESSPPPQKREMSKSGSMRNVSPGKREVSKTSSSSSSQSKSDRAPERRTSKSRHNSYEEKKEVERKSLGSNHSQEDDDDGGERRSSKSSQEDNRRVKAGAGGASGERPRSNHARDKEKEAIREKEANRDSLTNLKREYEGKMMKLQDLCAEKDRIIAGYMKEMERYQRVPNAPDGKLVPSGMLNGHATQLPIMGDCDKDGYLLTSKKGGQKYAVFYYKFDHDPDAAG